MENPCPAVTMAFDAFRMWKKIQWLQCLRKFR